MDRQCEVLLLSPGCDEEDVGTQAIDLLHELLTDTAAAELMFSSADLSTQFRHVILGNCTWREVRRAQMVRKYNNVYISESLLS